MRFNLKYLFFPLFSLGMHTWYAYNIYVLLPVSVLEVVTGNATLHSFKELLLSCFFVCEAALIILSSIFGGFIGDYLFFPIYRRFRVGRWKAHILFGTIICCITIVLRPFFVVRWNHENALISWLLPFLPKQGKQFTVTSIGSFVIFFLLCCIGDISYGIMSVGFYCLFNQNLPEEISGLIGGLTSSAETMGFLIGVTLFGSLYPNLGNVVSNLTITAYFFLLCAPLMFVFEERKYKKIHKTLKGRNLLSQAASPVADDDDEMRVASPDVDSKEKTEKKRPQSQENVQQEDENESIIIGGKKSHRRIKKHSPANKEDDSEKELTTITEDKSEKKEKQSKKKQQDAENSVPSNSLDVPRNSIEVTESTRLSIDSERGRISLDYNSTGDIGRASMDAGDVGRFSNDYLVDGVDLDASSNGRQSFGSDEKQIPKKIPILKIQDMDFLKFEKNKNKSNPTEQTNLVEKALKIMKKQFTWKKLKAAIWWKDFVVLFLLVVIEMNVLYSVQEWIGYFLKDVIKTENFTLPIPVFDGDLFKIPSLRWVQLTRSVEKAVSICLFLSNFTGVIFSALGGLLCQLIGPKFTLFLAFGLSALFSVLYCAFPIFSVIVALQIVIGIGDGLFFPSQLLYQNLLFNEKQKQSAENEDKQIKRKQQKDPKIGVGIGISSTAFIFPNVVLTPIAGLVLSLLKPFEKINIGNWEIRGTNYKILYAFDVFTCLLFMAICLFMTNRKSDKKNKNKNNSEVQLKDKSNLKNETELDNKIGMLTPATPIPADEHGKEKIKEISAAQVKELLIS